MAHVESPALIQQLGTLFEGGSVAGLSDRQLLERFLARRDPAAEAAFAAMVARHGPMVLGICRQLLGDHHHSEDAFQATFLVLARQARSIRDPDRLGTWLYGVAFRTARKVRARFDRRRKSEEDRAVKPPESGAADQADQSAMARERAEALHEEIGRLPGSFRLPIVLCYFEGLTPDEAARRLRCPAGTVHSRLVRARDKLRRGLTRRGVALPATALAAALAPRSASASVSSPLCDLTTRAAMNFAAGQAGSPLATAFAREVLRSMLIHDLRSALFNALALVAFTTGAGYLTHALVMKDGPMKAPAAPQPQVAATPDDANPKPVAAGPVDSALEPMAEELKLQSAARLMLMKETAARLEIHVKGNGGAKLELGAEPVMRWDNERSRVVDGSAFVWFDEHRPRVIGGMWFKDGHATFDLQSLSSEPLTAAVDGIPRWSTSRPGVSWEAVAGAPPPAASRGERLRQMKQLAKDFRVYAVKTPPDYDEGSVWHLRMLVQPIHRYAEQAAVDGAIFAFSQGTDPEAYLILESRPAEGISRWHFGMASACVWELHASRGAREVWSRPKWNPQDADTIYGLVGPFAVDPKLFPPELSKSRPAP